jgi:ParB family chromosome partitioning protein
MVKKKSSALGRGAAALFGNVTQSEEAPNPSVIEAAKAKLESALENKAEAIIKEKALDLNDGPLLVAIDDIKPNPDQPRKIFKEKDLEELSLSIKENGVIQPLIITRNEDGFVLIAGERRLKASKMAGLEKVPVVLKRGTKKDKMVMAIIENVQRADLNCVEEALAYFQLMDEFSLTQEEVAKKIGKDRSTIANFLRILKLPRPVIELVQKDLLSFGHAKILASLKEREEILRFGNLAVAENLSVRELETLIKKKKKKATQSASDSNTSINTETLKDQLEKTTGFHFNIKSKRNGSGQIIIKFNNEAEFNDVYDYLLKN